MMKKTACAIAIGSYDGSDNDVVIRYFCRSKFLKCDFFKPRPYMEIIECRYAKFKNQDRMQECTNEKCQIEALRFVKKMLLETK